MGVLDFWQQLQTGELALNKELHFVAADERDLAEIIIKEDNRLEKQRVGQSYHKARMSSNAEFLLNLVEEFVQGDRLIELRSRTLQSRRLTSLDRQRVEIEKRWSADREKISEDWRKLHIERSKLQARLERQVDLSPEELARLRHCQSECKKLEDQLKELEENIKAEMQSHKNSIAWLNILLVPLCFAGTGLGMSWRRRRRK